MYNVVTPTKTVPTPYVPPSPLPSSSSASPLNKKQTRQQSTTVATKGVVVSKDKIDQFVIEQRLKLEYDEMDTANLTNLCASMSKNGGQLIRDVEWMRKCVKQQKKHEELSQLDVEDELDFDDLISKLQTKLLYYMTLGLDQVEIQALMKHDLDVSGDCKRQVEKMIGKLVDSDHAIAVHWLRTTELVKVYRARALDYEPSLSEFLGTGGSSTQQKQQNSNNRARRDDNGSGSGRKTMSKKSESSGDGEDQKKKEKDGKDGNKKSTSGKDKDKSKDEKKKQEKKKAKKLDLSDLDDKDDLMKKEVWFKRVKGGYQLYATGSLGSSGHDEIYMRTTNYKWIVDHIVKGDEDNAPEYVRGVVDSVGKEKDRLTLGIKYQDSI